jgi:hypothetical protein
MNSEGDYASISKLKGMMISIINEMKEDMKKNKSLKS